MLLHVAARRNAMWRRGVATSKVAMHARGLAILPQMPAISSSFLRKEKKLRRTAEIKMGQLEEAQREALATPQFSTCNKPSEVLRMYESKRELLTPRDAAAAFFTMGKLARHAAYRVGGDPRCRLPCPWCPRRRRLWPEPRQVRVSRYHYSCDTFTSLKFCWF